LYVENRLFGQVKFDFLMKTNRFIRISDGKFACFKEKKEVFPVMQKDAEQFCWFNGMGITKMLESLALSKE
jgi:hypothetical protein